jgi:hypothetical protein
MDEGFEYVVYDIIISHEKNSPSDIYMFVFNPRLKSFNEINLKYIRNYGFDYTGTLNYGNLSYELAHKEFTRLFNKNQSEVFFHQDLKDDIKKNPGSDMKKNIHNPKDHLTPKKNPIYNRLSKQENKYIDTIIQYVKKKFKISLSHNEGIELYILLKHHANDWKREGIKQTPALELAVMKDYFDDLKRGHKKLQLKQNPSKNYTLPEWSAEFYQNFHNDIVNYREYLTKLTGKYCVFEGMISDKENKNIVTFIWTLGSYKDKNSTSWTGFLLSCILSVKFDYADEYSAKSDLYNSDTEKTTSINSWGGPFNIDKLSDPKYWFGSIKYMTDKEKGIK